ncbi:hypothetical protein ABW19_dt0204248 [Dactylella cylindrospora]|nr:hypothetical protein ABW19_dt0204248 [Dactylella cylindrospora]
MQGTADGDVFDPTKDDGVGANYEGSQAGASFLDRSSSTGLSPSRRLAHEKPALLAKYSDEEIEELEVGLKIYGGD